MCIIEVTDIWVCPCADKECPCIRPAERRVALRFNTEHIGHIIKADRYKMVCSWEPCDEFQALHVSEQSSDEEPPDEQSSDAQSSDEQSSDEQSSDEQSSDNSVVSQHTIQLCVEHCPNFRAIVQGGSVMQTMDQLRSRCQDSQSPCSGETTLQWMMLCPDAQDCAYYAEMTAIVLDILGDV